MGSLQQHPPRVFDVILHLDQELDSLPAIQEPVIVGQGEVHHRSSLDLAIDDDSALLHSMEPKDGGLREVDNGRTHQRAENATVADSEGPTSHVLNSQLPIPGLVTAISMPFNDRLVMDIEPIPSCPCRR